MSNLITTCLRTGFLQGLFPKNFSYIFLEGIFRGVKVTFTPFAEFHRFWQFQIGSLNNYLINLSIMNNHATCNSWWIKTGKTSYNSNVVQKQMNCESNLFITHIYLKLYFSFLRSSHQRCSVKKVFSEVSQNSQVFLVNFVKFLRTPFRTDHLWWLLLFPDILRECYWLFNPLAFFKHFFYHWFLSILPWKHPKIRGVWCFQRVFWCFQGV